MGSIHYSIHPQQVGNLVGFERMIERVNQMQTQTSNKNNYPPYNIAKTGEDTYRVEIACAGFNEDDFDIELKDSILSVSAAKDDEDTTEYVFRGIAARPFTRTFTLAETIEVEDVTLVNGMLEISLVNVIPEEQRPKKFSVNSQKTLLQE